MTSNIELGTILVVDDNLDVREFAKTFLETAGYTVITAIDGEEALRLNEKHQSTVVLLLTEVVMPNINGFELADRVLGIDAQLPVLFMSGEAWSPYRGLDCLVKPFRSAELVEGVRRALNTAHTRDERLPAHSAGYEGGGHPILAMSGLKQGDWFRS